MKLQDKVVWVTGASSGIGEALAYALSKMGCRLIISARRESELERVKSSCAIPENVKVLPLDLCDTESLADKVEDAISLYGSIDLLINNGGISQRSLASETTIEVDKKMMEVNYLGTVALTKALLPHYKMNQGGHIAVVTSLVGKFGTPYRSGYAASKHALHGFFDSLRAEVYQDNISITMICPGFVKTNLSINSLTEDGSKQGTPDETHLNGMPADVFARKTINAIQKEKAEVYIGRKEVIGVYIKRFFPSLFNRIIRKATVR